MTPSAHVGKKTLLELFARLGCVKVVGHAQESLDLR